MNIKLIVDGKQWELDGDEKFLIRYWILSRGGHKNEDGQRYMHNFVLPALAKGKEKE